MSRSAKAAIAVEQTGCPSCAEPGSTLHSRLVDRHFRAPGSWSLLGCQGCDLVWLNPRPLPDTIAALYRDYYTHATPAPETRLQRIVHRGIPASLGYGVETASSADLRWGRLLAHIGPLRELALQSVMWLPRKPTGRLLEVGCGAGLLLERMRDCGWAVQGIEPDARAAALAARAVGQDAIHVGTLDDAPFSEGSFDAIVLYHVIEHLLDPRDALERCRRYLRPGGRLVIATPNIHSLGRRRFGASWLHWDPPRHIQLHSPRSLGALVKQSGFRIQRLLTPSTSSPVIWAGSALLRKRGSLPAVDTSVAPRRVKLAALGFWGWEYLQTRMGKACGEDLVILAEPSAQPYPVDATGPDRTTRP